MAEGVMSMNMPTKGTFGHVGTGLVAGSLIGLGFPIEGGVITGWVAVRQSVSWLHKRDAVGKDMMEHMAALVPAIIAGLLIRHLS